MFFVVFSQDYTFGVLLAVSTLLLWWWFQGSHNGLVSKGQSTTLGFLFQERGRERESYLIKDVFKFVLRQGRALNVLDGAQIFSHTLTVLLTHRLHSLFCQLLSHLRVITKIRLSTDDQAGNTRAVMMNLRKPFLANVLKRSR